MTSVSLAKGGNVSLSKVAPNLTAVTVGLGWQVRQTYGADYDLDASAIVLNEAGRVINDQFFVFFNNLTSPDRAVHHLGDNLVGGGGGDDEQITVDLGTLTPQAAKVVFAVSIYDAEARRQTFGQIRDAFIRVADSTTEAEIARYDLTEDASSETAMIFGELYRYNGEWKFRAVGQGYATGLRGIALDFGVNVS
jgi:tellurium resistance protein TerD